LARESGQEVWWRATGRLAFATVAGVGALMLAPWLFTAALDGRAILGMPMAYFLFAMAAPIAIFIAILWFAGRQHRLDDRYDVTGNQA
jgi:putative solute:sodium symporter small subunit